MKRRILLCVSSLSAAQRVQTLNPASWSVEVVDSLIEARRAAMSDRFLVGMISIESSACSELSQVRGLVHCTTDMQWIALLPSSLISEPPVAQLICTSFYDFHTVPVDPVLLRSTLGHCYGMAMLKKATAAADPASLPKPLEIVGESPQMQHVFRTLRKLANTDAPVLISGESGTGKELAARALHAQTRRANAPFVAVNCGALPHALIQSELFGHEKGAFTGAHGRAVGRIEAAQHGTIFLDEIADLPLDLQVNLLRFLQEGTIERVGSARQIAVDTRVVAASNKPLEKVVSEKLFRADLFYRLNVLRLELPPLRDREGDARRLAQFFFEKYATTDRTGAKGFSPEALRCIDAHSWPGNVRELTNRVRRAMVMSDNAFITPTDLELETVEDRRAGGTLEQFRAVADAKLIVDTLKHTNNNVTEAARKLGISRMTLYRLMKRQREMPV